MLTVDDVLMIDRSPPSLAPISRDQLPPDSVVICATLRLAQTLAKAHDMAAGHVTSWRTLHSTTYAQWLLALYEAMTLRDLAPPALQGVRVLDTFQEQLIWEQIVHEHLDRNTSMLFDVRALAATAAEAHALIINWNIASTGDFGSAFASEEQTQFRHWRERFLEHCRDHRLIDSASLNDILIRHIQHSDMPLPAAIGFAGFDHYTPLEQRLQTALQTRGCTLHTLTSATAAPGAPQLHTATDLYQECLSVAHWAHKHLQTNPRCRIGIVAPDLAAYQHPLTNALEDVIDPSLVLARHAEQPRPFNVSLGQPLSTYPVVRIALTLLQALTQSHAVEQRTISELLLSPYWSVKGESDARARLDSALREGVAPKAPLKRYDSYAHYLVHKQTLTAPYTLGYLQTMLSTAQGLSNRSRLPSAWRRIFQTILGQSGWLADAHLDSHEFQTHEAFAKELGKLAQLDQITGAITFSRAVALLSQQCNERLFQPKTRGTPPIQILGVLEAAGLEFDATWIMGLTDAAWPPAAKPNPLLSAETQRTAGSPNACATVQLDFARRIQHRLLQSAPELHISYPQQAQAVTLLPSPLLRELSPATPLPPMVVPWAGHLPEGPSQLEAIDDAMAPGVPEGHKVSGGTGLLRAQAICPAWGFYQYRLGAKALAVPTEGLDPRQRGTLVHDTLELFWKATGDLSTLQAMSDQTRQAAVAQAARSALDKFNADQKQEALKPRQAALEQQRLQRLIDAWLQLETTRKEAFTVLEAEGARDIMIEGIVTHLRIDRIDQLADGRTLIIDYKTGASIDTRNWANDRITEPQLPIYAAIADHPNGEIAGVAFGQVHVTGVGFKGVCQDNHLLPNVHAVDSDKGRRQFDDVRFPDWPSVLQHWRDAIHRVAREVRAGDASVRITSDNDLRYCDVLPLLRIRERQQQLDAVLQTAAPTYTNSAPTV